MSTVHTQTIPLYNKGALSATGYRTGAGYNVKLNYGNVELSSRPSLYECVLHAYIGIRLKSPKFHDWLTEDLRTTVLKELDEMDKLIDGRITSYRNEGLKDILSKGMKWEIDNNLVITLDAGDEYPEKTIEHFKKIFFDDFLKAPKLVVHIRMMSPFRDKDDLFEVSLFEDKQQDKPYMSVMESNLPSSLFNREWIDNAKNSFNAYRRASAPVQPGINPAMYHPLTPLHPGIQIPTQQFGVGINQQNPLYSYGTGTPAQFKLQGSGGEADIVLNGSTVSLTASGNVTVEAPLLNVTAGGASAFTSDMFNIEDPEASKLDPRVALIYREMPYKTSYGTWDMGLVTFLETKLHWDWKEIPLLDYLKKHYRHKYQGRDPQVKIFVESLAEMLEIEVI